MCPMKFDKFNHLNLISDLFATKVHFHDKNFELTKLCQVLKWLLEQIQLTFSRYGKERNVPQSDQYDNAPKVSSASI